MFFVLIVLFLYRGCFCRYFCNFYIDVLVSYFCLLLVSLCIMIMFLQLFLLLLKVIYDAPVSFVTAVAPVGLVAGAVAIAGTIVAVVLLLLILLLLLLVFMLSLLFVVLIVLQCCCCSCFICEIWIRFMLISFSHTLTFQ